MSYTLKDGFCEMIAVSPEARRGDVKANTDLKQGMAVVVVNSAGSAVANKASGTGEYDVYFAKKYGRNEVNQLYAGNSIEAITSGERFVCIGRGSTISIDQYVGAIGDYDIGDYLEIGTSGNAGLVTNYNSTPVGDPVAVVVGKDYNKLIIKVL